MLPGHSHAFTETFVEAAAVQPRDGHAWDYFLHSSRDAFGQAFWDAKTAPEYALPSPLFTPGPYRYLDRLITDATRPAFAFLLQVCTFDFPQRVVPISLGFTPWTVHAPVDLLAPFCVAAPGAHASRVFGLGTDGQLGGGYQLLRINTATGLLNVFGMPPPAFAGPKHRRSPTRRPTGCTRSTGPRRRWSRIT